MLEAGIEGGRVRGLVEVAVVVVVALGRWEKREVGKA